MNKRKVWFWLMSISSIVYILWRLIYTIPTQAGGVSLVAGIALFIAELISMLEAIIHYICMSQEKEPEIPIISDEDYSDVDVFIATHSEEVELLYKTINGCKHMDYPDKKKVHIYLCDDGNRPEVAHLAESMQIGYFAIEDNKEAKAGNLNNALSKTNSPLIVTFDADMIPRSNFLLQTVPYFALPEMIKEDGIWRKRTDKEMNPEYRIGFIQTPQSFFNPDLFQFNFFAENTIPNEQDYFFKEVNFGRNSSNSPIYAGSNTVISRKALEEVNGIRTGTITEDFATGIDIQMKGYTCFAIKKVLASGLAPDDFANLLKQRQRWGRGCVQTILSTKFWFSKLPIISKLSYFSCLLYWWTFLRRIVYVLSPILFTVFGVLVVKTDLQGILFIWLPSYLIYNYSLRLLSGKIRDQKWSNIVDTILCPYMIIPIASETFGIRMKQFAVTSKEKAGSRSTRLVYAIPHCILLIATIVGICFCVMEMMVNSTVLVLVVLFWLCMNMYFLSMAVLFMIGRINYRNSERFKVEMPVKILAGTKEMKVTICDISECGFALKTDFPEFINGICEFFLDNGKEEVKVKGEVVYVMQINNEWKYGVKIEKLVGEGKQQYYQIVYNRYPTLATEIKTTAWQDLYVFFKKLASKSVKSDRKLPRIAMNCELETVDGLKVNVVDYNYQYMTIVDDIQEPEFDLNFGNTKLQLEKVKDSNIKNENLYLVKNWQEVSASDEIRTAIKYVIEIKKKFKN